MSIFKIKEYDCCYYLDSNRNIPCSFYPGILFVCLYWGSLWSKSIEEYFNSPKYDLPDEFTIEVVKEKSTISAKPSASQTGPSAQPSSAEETLSSDAPPRTTGKGGYVPE